MEEITVLSPPVQAYQDINVINVTAIDNPNTFKIE